MSEARIGALAGIDCGKPLTQLLQLLAEQTLSIPLRQQMRSIMKIDCLPPNGDRKIENVFSNMPPDFPNEVIETLLETDKLRIERIVSHGDASPVGCWYDQDQHEWVIVLQGAAKLRFDGVEQPVELKSGDFVNIPAHTRHRVEWTTPEEPTIWLAVHYA